MRFFSGRVGYEILRGGEKFSIVCVKFSGGLRNIPGVENAVALTNFQGGCMGNFQGVLRHFQGGLKNF